MKSSWQPIIGLEVHVELKTESKMFCRCKNEHFDIRPNTNVCPVCLGLPGALPVPNKTAVEQTIMIALAFGCKINQDFWFDRKNYFYPDLPKSFQISQHFHPIGVGGSVPIILNGQTKKIALSDLHLEEDTGKSIHTQNKTLLDFNRSGVPLVEIVTKPVLRSSQEAKAYLKRIQQTIRWLELSDCDMEKGSMRLEANISVKDIEKDKSDKLPNYKVEVKNLNSFRFVQKAIDYEIARQITLLSEGQTPKQETRGFDSGKGTTYSQRSKETSKDYRYFPEPDIPPFTFTDEKIEQLRKTLGQLPWQQEQILIKLGIPQNWTKIITKDKKTAELIQKAISLAEKKNIRPKKIANIIVNDATEFTNAQEIIDKIITQENKFSSSEQEIEGAVKKAIEQNPQAAKDYRSGKTQVVGFFIGQVQKICKGKADPKITAQKVAQLLNH